MSLSIVVPTRGRPSLYATLRSIVDAGFAVGDEVIVVGDGKQDEAREMCAFLARRLKIVYTETPKAAHDWGHTPSNLGYKLAVGDHVLRIDDDDTYVNGAFDKVRAAVKESPVRVIIFKMVALARRLAYDVLWRSPDFGLGNVGTPMFVVPNDKRKMGEWGQGAYTGDFDFISSTVAKWGGAEKIVWKEDVIAEIR